MLVRTKKRLEQEAIYSLKIVCTQSTEFNFIWLMQTTQHPLWLSRSTDLLNDEQ